MAIEKILQDWKKGNVKQVYWLEGEESYYIDQVTDYAEHHLLPEAEASFNLSVFYGRDAAWSDVLNACMRYPMFAERQVVVLKEAQQMKDIDKLEHYLLNPLASTVFVVAYKDKKLDGRGSLAKKLKDREQLFSTKKIYDNQLPDWISALAESKGYEMSQKAVMLMADHIGNDLSRISNEIEKLTVNLAGRKTISEDDIERYVGVSKEFNVFELQEALAKKDLARAVRIIVYFESNPKAYPIQLILPALYNYFAKVFGVFGLSDKSENALKPHFYNNIIAARQAANTMKNYGYEGVERVILLLHHYNLKSVGVDDAGSSDAALLKELAVKMIA
jgi:DNA polymerase-3 subunit delta